MSGPKPTRKFVAHDPCTRLILTIALCSAAFISRPTSSDVTGELIVDQTVADRNALTTSLRLMEPGLQQYADFSQLIRHGDAYVRGQGGLFAVFNQSTYVKAEQGSPDRPVIPAGTVFHIGSPPITQPRASDTPLSRARALTVGGLTMSPRIDTALMPGALPLPDEPRTEDVGPRSDAMRPRSHHRLPRRDAGLGPHGTADVANWLPGPEPARGFAHPVERAMRMQALLRELARRGEST